MNITDVHVRKITQEGKMKAVVSITLDDVFVVHDIKVIEGEKGLFIAMPSKKTADGEYRDIAHPINSAKRELLQTTILSAYKEALTAPEFQGKLLFSIYFSRRKRVTKTVAGGQRSFTAKASVLSQGQLCVTDIYREE